MKISTAFSNVQSLELLGNKPHTSVANLLVILSSINICQYDVTSRRSEEVDIYHHYLVSFCFSLVLVASYTYNRCHVM